MSVCPIQGRFDGERCRLRMVPLGESQTGPTTLTPTPWTPQQDLRGIGEGVGMTFDQHGRRASERTEARDVGSDRRHPRCHRFEHRQAETLLAGGRSQQEIAGPHEIRDFVRTQVVVEFVGLEHLSLIVGQRPLREADPLDIEAAVSQATHRVGCNLDTFELDLPRPGRKDSRGSARRRQPERR